MTPNGRTLARAERIAIALLIAGLGALAAPAVPGRAWTAVLVGGAAAVAVAARRETLADATGSRPLPAPVPGLRPVGAFLASASAVHSPSAPRAPPLPARR